MTVYVVLECFPYEGCELDEVFATREAAEKYAEQYPGYGRCVVEKEVRSE